MARGGYFGLVLRVGFGLALRVGLGFIAETYAIARGAGPVNAATAPACSGLFNGEAA